MYTPLQLILRYLNYYLRAHNGKGHGVHSPFVFDFITKVLNDRADDPVCQEIEKDRRRLLQDKRIITVQDFGAGSGVIRNNERKVSAIAASSLKPVKYARLLHRIVRYYQPQHILELGTSFGITSRYLASANPAAHLYTLEGAPSIAAMAREQFQNAQCNNITLLEGEFSSTLPQVLQTMTSVDLAFIDGNHRYEPTLDYFNRIRQNTHAGSILIFDDIHWSADMEKAWKHIHSDPSVTLSIDLFFIGLLFFNPSFRVKQHFPIRY